MSSNLTLKCLRSKYHEFNEKYFNNAIKGKIIIEYDEFKNMDRRYLGTASCRDSVSIYFDGIQRTNIIKINKRLKKLNVSDIAIDTILIHEMIHLLLFDIKIPPTQVHGSKFQNHCKRIKNMTPELDLTYNECLTMREDLIPGFFK